MNKEYDVDKGFSVSFDKDKILGFIESVRFQREAEKKWKGESRFCKTRLEQKRKVKKRG